MHSYIELLVTQLREDSPRDAILKSSQGLVEHLLQHPKSFSANWHPLGFIHVKLPVSQSGASLRLHVWPEHTRSVQDPAWQVHDHVFALTSFVLVGALNNYEYSVDETDVGPTGRIYEVSYDSLVSVLHASTRLVKHELRLLTTQECGSIYRIPRGIFHSTEVPIGQFASTIVLSDDVSAKPPLVVGDLNGGAEYRYVRELCDQSFLQRQLKTLLESLGR